MKFLENYNTYSKKNQDYKLISGHNKLLKKLNLNSSILSYKSISIIGIYKIFKSLLTQDNIHLSDEHMMLIVIYVLTNKLKLNLELTKKLQIELEAEIPDFNTLVKKFTHSLHTLFVTVNMVFKKDTIVIGNFEKLLKIKIILKVLNLINDFINEHNLGLHKFSYLIYEKKEEVLKNIVKFVDLNSAKDRYYIEDTFIKENVSKKLPEYLYHLTSAKKYESIKEVGLDPQYSIQSKGDHGIYLADDEGVASNYSGFYDEEELVLLKISTKGLSVDNFGPDDYELQDHLNSNNRRRFDNWYDVPWYLSLKYCSQVQYHGVISPQNIEVIETWYEGENKNYLGRPHKTSESVQYKFKNELQRKYLKSFESYLSTDMLNDILDEISEYGIDSLSEYQMRLLKSYSDKNIDVEEEIQKHQNKYLTAKSIIKDVVPLAVENSDLEKNIGRFIKYKIKKGEEEKCGSIIAGGSIFEIVGIQKHWGRDEEGKYVPDRIGYRVALVGYDNDFGQVCSVEEAEFVNISEDEAIKINKKITPELGDFFSK